MIDRHAVQQLLAAGVRPRQVAKQFGVARRTVERIAREPAVTSDDAVVRGARRLGRPAVAAALRERVAAWLELGKGRVEIRSVGEVVLGRGAGKGAQPRSSSWAASRVKLPG